MAPGVGLHCLPMSHKKGAMRLWVKQPNRYKGLLFSLSLRLFLIVVHASSEVSDETAQMFRHARVLAARGCM